jgi:hypothetical protein
MIRSAASKSDAHHSTQTKKLGICMIRLIELSSNFDCTENIEKVF